ncbi:MAG: TIGR02757 family protein [Pseudomonadota bacterium]
MDTEVGRLTNRLEAIYAQYNQRVYIDPDPLLYLYNYSDKKNREIAGFIAACCAYGQVLQIMKTVEHVLEKMKPSPHGYLIEKSKSDMAEDFKGFGYRFARDTHLVDLLVGIQGVLNRFGSLENCFYAGMSPTDETVLPGLVYFCRQLDPEKSIGHLLADPEKNSACKRSHLFLRWMVRQDQVDPGGWTRIDPSRLIIPLDRHMHRIGLLLGFTSRKGADLKTALEITRGFAKIMPHDPVKYDFCLTRYGIRNELSLEDLKEKVYT